VRLASWMLLKNTYGHTLPLCSYESPRIFRPLAGSGLPWMKFLPLELHSDGSGRLAYPTSRVHVCHCEFMNGIGDVLK
jgi:hypothetical protein